MLQKDGIEDFRPLDFSVETDEDASDNQQYGNGIDQMSVTENSNKNEGYDLRNLPEYNMETKADFKGNQEAIDWMMKDPNDYNVKSYEDSSVLEDMDDFRQSQDPSLKEDDGKEHNTYSSFHHHRNHGSKRHHDTIAEDSFDQGLDLHSDTQSSLNENEMTTRNNRHRHEKATGWKDKYDDDDDDESSENGNVSNREMSWDQNDDDDHDGIIYDKDTLNDIEQSPRETTMKNLNSRIKNQDAKLFKELENFQNNDNFGNADSDVLGNFDDESDELENIRDISESIENHDEESNSVEEDKLSKERKTDDKHDDNDDESESKYEKEISDNEDKISTANGRKDNDYQEDNDRGSEQANETYDDEDKISNNVNGDDYQNDNDQGSGDENNSVSDQLGSKNGKEDKPNSKSYGNKDSEDGKSSPHDEEEDETKDKGGKESTKANDMSSAQKISNIKTKHANREDKLKVMKGKETENNDNHKPLHESAHSSNNAKNSEKSQEKKVTKEDKGIQVVSINEKEDLSNRKLIEETPIQSKDDNEMHIPTDSIGHEVETTTINIENGKQSNSKDKDYDNNKLLQEPNIMSQGDNEKHIPTDYLINDEKFTSTSSTANNGKHSTNTGPKLQHSNSDTRQASLSDSKYNEKITTETHDESNRQRLIDQKLKDIEIKMERISETKPRAGRIERKKAQHHKVNKYDRDDNKNRPTSTGFRRNQPNYGPSTSIYSLADLQKLQRIVSYLRGTATTRASPTRTSTLNPNSFSLNNLFYYPMHPTPQDQNDATPGTKGRRVNCSSLDSPWRPFFQAIQLNSRETIYSVFSLQSNLT